MVANDIALLGGAGEEKVPSSDRGRKVGAGVAGNGGKHAAAAEITDGMDNLAHRCCRDQAAPDLADRSN